MIKYSKQYPPMEFKAHMIYKALLRLLLDSTIVISSLLCLKAKLCISSILAQNRRQKYIRKIPVSQKANALFIHSARPQKCFWL